MRPKKITTEDQENLIKDNYLELSDKELSELTGAPVWCIQKYRSDHNLYKKRQHETGMEVIGNGLFYVKERSNWLI